MSPKEIKVGETYRNRGAGRTQRKVLTIDQRIPADWYSPHPAPDEPKVFYEQDGKERVLYLSSFAKWAGSRVELT